MTNKHRKIKQFIRSEARFITFMKRGGCSKEQIRRQLRKRFEQQRKIKIETLNARLSQQQRSFFVSELLSNPDKFPLHEFIKDWEGVLDEGGNPVPYSPENVRKVMSSDGGKVVLGEMLREIGVIDD